MNTIMRNIKLSSKLLLLLSIPIAGSAQVTLTGASCARTGLEYQYNVSATLDSSIIMTFCVTGGKFTTGETCITGSPKSFVHVIWNYGASSGSLSTNSVEGNASFAVNLTDSLLPGQISESLNVQLMDSNSVPQIISCSEATGGACNAQYRYQWESSPDCLSWQAIPNNTERDLILGPPTSSSVYYRRKVIEMQSTEIGFSNISAVFIR